MHGARTSTLDCPMVTTRYGAAAGLEQGTRHGGNHVGQGMHSLRDVGQGGYWCWRQNFVGRRATLWLFCSQFAAAAHQGVWTGGRS